MPDRAAATAIREPVETEHASKWGFEGLRQALAGEVTGLGTKVTLVEPDGAYGNA